MKHTKYYPIFLNMSNMPCVVVGGGRIAERKIVNLADHGAIVTVISPEVLPKIARLIDAKKISWTAQRYKSAHLRGARLAIAATNDPQVNTAVYQDAEKRGILVNSVDDPAHCRFIVPALGNCGDIQLAVVTGGGAPGISSLVRDELETVIGKKYSALVNELKKRRDRIRLLPHEKKRVFWDAILERASRGECADRSSAIAAINELLKNVGRTPN